MSRILHSSNVIIPVQNFRYLVIHLDSKLTLGTHVKTALSNTAVAIHPCKSSCPTRDELGCFRINRSLRYFIRRNLKSS